MNLLRKIVRFLRLLEEPYYEVRLPVWEHHRDRTEANRIRVLWTGSQVAPVPILLREREEDG